MKIPSQTDPTIEAIKEIISQRPSEQRKYVGASSIGDECVRKLWYGLHRDRPPAKYQLAIEDGHRSEAIMAERLRMVDGIELWTGEHCEFEDGNFKGHWDGVIKGIIQAPKTTHIWEHKCSKDFNKVVKLKEKHNEKMVLEKWDYNYFIQAQIYMHYSGIKRHYMTVCSPGSRDMTSIRTEYQKDIAIRYIDRAKKLQKATETPPRAYQSDTFYKCKWCDFREECWSENT